MLRFFVECEDIPTDVHVRSRRQRQVCIGDSITEAQAIGWVQADVDADAIEASIAAQIADSTTPAVATGTPW